MSEKTTIDVSELVVKMKEILDPIVQSHSNKQNYVALMGVAISFGCAVRVRPEKQIKMFAELLDSITQQLENHFNNEELENDE